MCSVYAPVSYTHLLSVGQSSDCELLDFEVDGQVDCAALPENLNRFMPEGIVAVDLSLIHI